jgi:hypothetical protein
MVDKTEYRVRGWLVGFSMKIIARDNHISAPKGAFMALITNSAIWQFRNWPRLFTLFEVGQKELPR